MAIPVVGDSAHHHRYRGRAPFASCHFHQKGITLWESALRRLFHAGYTTWVQGDVVDLIDFPIWPPSSSGLSPMPHEPWVAPNFPPSLEACRPRCAHRPRLQKPFLRSPAAIESPSRSGERYSLTRFTRRARLRSRALFCAGLPGQELIRLEENHPCPFCPCSMAS